MVEFSIEYKKGKLVVVINGQEIKEPRHVEMVLPIYTDPYIKIGQRISEPGSIEQSVMTVLTNIGEVSIKGSLDGIL